MTDKNLKYYDDRFFEDQIGWKDDYLLISEWINLNVNGEIFGDIGCGNGLLITNLFKNNGKKVWGVDGSDNFIKYVDKLIIPFVAKIDLTEKNKLAKADVAICMEVAEHLPFESSETLINNIVSTDPSVIVFTAAPPGQPGTNHINLQKHKFWIDKFKKRGYFLKKQFSDKFRADLTGKIRSTVWYLDNFMVFEKKSDSVKEKINNFINNICRKLV